MNYSNADIHSCTLFAGHEEIVYLSFKKLANEYGTGFKVYRTKDLPAEWKANNPDRFGSVIIIADPNFGFQDLYNFMRFYPYYYEHRGNVNSYIQFNQFNFHTNFPQQDFESTNSVWPL